MIVLDTNVVSELMRPGPSPEVVAWLDAQNPRDMYLTAVTVAELVYGIARLPGGKRRDEIARSLEMVLDEDFSGRILAFDDVAARHYGEIAAERDRLGRPISMADAQIAAVCVSHAAVVATRNGRDFEGTGVHVVDPWAAT